MAYLLGSNNDAEVRHLKTEVQTLQAELTQCQADKDFVWSLWKRLQVSEPDMAQAVGLVLQRETEQVETRDRQILALLDAKDQYINELEETLHHREEEMTGIMQKKSDYEVKVTELEQNLEVLQKHMSNIQPPKTNNDLIQAQKTNDDLIQAHKTIQELEEKLHLSEQEVENLKTVKSEEKEPHKQEIVENKSLRKKLKKALTEVKQKDKELQAVRVELKEVWETHMQTAGHVTQQAALIRQLQNLQNDTDKMLKTTESTCTIETSTLKSENEQLHLQVEKLEKMLKTRDDIITDLEFMVLEFDPKRKGRSISFAKKLARSNSLDSERGRRAVQRRKYSDPHIKRRSSSAQPRTQSLAAIYDRRAMHNRLQSSEKTLMETQALLKAKMSELRSLKQSHDRRLDRLKSVQEQYRIMKEQMQILEEECNGPRQKRKKTPRPHAKQLQKEDSDAVWNEVAYLRKENKKLTTDKMNLMEERDALHVALTTVESNRVEEKTRTDKLKEALKAREKRVSKADVHELESQRDQAVQAEERLNKRIRELQEECTQLNEAHIRTLHEKRALMDELNSIKQEEMVNIETIAHLRQQLDRLERQTKEKDSGGSGRSGKLLQEIDKYDRGDAPIDSDGVELNSTDHTQDSAQSLGQSIAIQASLNHSQTLVPTHRSTQTRLPSYRSVALSPIRDSVRSSRSQPVLSSGYSNRHDLDTYRDMAGNEDATRPTEINPQKLDEQSEPEIPGLVGKAVGRGTNKAGSNKRMGGSKVVTSLKQRISSLQHQVAALRESKRSYTKECRDLRASLQQADNELVTVNQRLSSAKTSLQHMASEVDRLKLDKAELEDQLEQIQANKKEEHELASLQQRHKALASDLSKQNQLLRDLKAENEKLQEKNQSFQDRIKSLERDCSQKKVLCDELRGKQRTIEQNSQTNNCLLEEKTNMINSLSDTNQRLKTQLDSMKQRLTATREDKGSNQEKIHQLTQQVEKKGKQASELQSKLRKANNDMASLERAVQQQFNSLADQSEVAMEAAQKKLGQAATKIKEFCKFVKKLENYLDTSLEKEQQSLHQLKDSQPPVSEAKKEGPFEPMGYTRSCEILGMTANELEDFMSGNNSRETSFSVQPQEVATEKRESRQKKQFEKLISANKADFSEELLHVVMDSIEERCELIKQQVQPEPATDRS